MDSPPDHYAKGIKRQRNKKKNKEDKKEVLNELKKVQTGQRQSTIYRKRRRTGIRPKDYEIY